jgi:hypothetical protein
MRDQHKSLSIILAMLLAFSNMAISGHISSHQLLDSESCTYCFQHGGSDSAVLPSPNEIPYIQTDFAPRVDILANNIQPANLYDHPSRAPPGIT